MAKLQPIVPGTGPDVRAEGPIVGSILDVTYGSALQDDNTDKVAVIVNHGMGQQVPFETLELVAEALQVADQNAGNPKVDIKARIVRLGDKGKPEEIQLARAELTLGGKGGRQVHLFEAYWAPLTEGKVTISDVILFLLNAGCDGLRNSKSKKFRRWMFGDWQEFDLERWKLMLSFVGAILVVLSLIVINTVIVAVATSQALTKGPSGWPSGKLLDRFTIDMGIVDALAFLIWLGVKWIPSWCRRRSRSVPHACWYLVGAGLGGVVVMSAVILFQLCVWRHDASPGWNIGWLDCLLAAFWFLVGKATYAVRTLLVQYVGDVAAYVSAHTVSKFWEVRKAIYETAKKVAQAVYKAQKPSGGEFKYDRVIVVGHSLGSVIGYDVLNGLLLEEQKTEPGQHIAERTRLFMTFGSPLDKTAFIFRTQKEEDSGLREAAAAAVQPMILDYGNRPLNWVNLYSHSDWISGSLEYYDHQNEGIGGEKRVKNILDPEATSPLVAHTEYWRGKRFADVLYRAVMAE
jgi:hypothetical protein